MVSTQHPIGLEDKSQIDSIMQEKFGINSICIKGVCRTPLSQGRSVYNVWAQRDNGRVAMYVVNTDRISGKLADPASSLDSYELLMKMFSLSS